MPNAPVQWDYSNPLAAEEQFKALLPAARESEDRSYLVQLLTQIARAQGLHGKFPEAHATLDEAEHLLTPDLSAAGIRYLPCTC